MPQNGHCAEARVLPGNRGALPLRKGKKVSTIPAADEKRWFENERFLPALPPAQAVLRQKVPGKNAFEEPCVLPALSHLSTSDSGSADH